MKLILPDIEPCESCGGALPLDCDGSGMIVCPHCMADTGHVLCPVCADFEDDDSGDDGDGMRAAA